jgi:hypothetical protein
MNRNIEEYKLLNQNIVEQLKIIEETDGINSEKAKEYRLVKNRLYILISALENNRTIIKPPLLSQIEPYFIINVINKI